MVKFSVEAYSWAWNVKPADVPKAEQPAGRGVQTQGQFRGWPEHSIFYQDAVGQIQGISEAAQNIVGLFFDLLDSF